MKVVNHNNPIYNGTMKPGLYRVVTSYFVAGFVVEPNGAVRRCAPILRKKLTYWMTIAKWVSL